MASLLENAQQAVGPDEPVQFAFTAQTGLKPTWRLLSLWLVIANKPRIIVVTAGRILVYRAGKLRFSRMMPKGLLYEVPRATCLGPLRGTWSRLEFGSEGVWVARSAYPLIDKANEAAGLTGLRLAIA